MTSYRPIDSRREEFRKYLERAGVMAALTKALVALYDVPEKPSDALDFLRKNLGDDRPEREELIESQNIAEEYRTRVELLEERITEMEMRLQKYGEEVPDVCLDETEAAAGEAAEAEETEQPMS